MRVLVQKANVHGQIDAIVSKSYAHRIAICNFLAGNPPVSNSGDFSSNDIRVTEQCLTALKCRKTVLDCGESGSTLRFLIPILATLGGEYKLIGHGRLMQRPNQPLFEVLNSHGVETSQNDECVTIRGKLDSGEYRIRGDVSSQYVSGLLMALPNIEGDSKVVLTTPLASAPYVDITIEVLKNFGVIIQKTDYGFFIKGCQKFSGDVTPEGDWSNSAFFLVLGAISGALSVGGLNPDSVQGDRAIIDVIRSANGNVIYQNGAFSVYKSNLIPFTMDAQDCPDLVPIASVLGAFANGDSVIKNVARLRLKESDRIETTINMLNAFNVKAKCVGDSLVISGGTARYGTVESFNDHRIAMASAIISSAVEGESVIVDAEAVNKSYPTFYNDLRKVGGKVDEI